MSSVPKPPRPFKIWSCDRQIKKAVVVSSFDELKEKGRQKLLYDNLLELVVVLENDGTEVEDDVYFDTLEKDTVFQLLRPGEKWVSPRVPVPLEYYSGDSYGIQIRDVSSAVQPQGSTGTSRSNVKPVSKIQRKPVAKKGPLKSGVSKGPKHVEKVTPNSTLQFHSYVRESPSDDEFFVEPPKEAVRESPKSIHYFCDLTLPGKKRPACPNSCPTKSKSRRTNKRPTEDTIAADIISSDFLETAASPEPSAAQTVRLCDERVFWSHAATQQLIRSYTYYKAHFDQPRGQLKNIWRLVAKKMQFYGFMVSAKACDKKWRNLKMTYRTINKKMSLGSIKTRKSWQYFGLMREAMRPVRLVSESEAGSEDNVDCDRSDCDWLAEFFLQKREQETQELEEIRRVSQHSIEQLRKENESLQLLNDYLASCVT